MAEDTSRLAFPANERQRLIDERIAKVKANQSAG